MIAATLTEKADCLCDLGQLEAAAATYEKQISFSQSLSDFRAVAVGKGQLAMVRTLQGRYEEAVAGYTDTRTFFEQQNESASVASAWHRLGIAYQEAGSYDAAEAAYRQALEINTGLDDQLEQASNLGQLGILYDIGFKKLEFTVTFFRQAANIYVELNDLHHEGLVRGNIARALVKLQQYEEARGEALRAIECDQPFGHAAKPWTSFGILQDIETATGNPAAARTAWQQARDAYLAYRQQGGYAQGSGGKLVDEVLRLLAQQPINDVQSQLAELTNKPEAPEFRKQLIQAMVAILNGSRDLTLADDPALHYADAAEVLFFMERLTS